MNNDEVLSQVENNFAGQISGLVGLLSQEQVANRHLKQEIADLKVKLDQAQKGSDNDGTNKAISKH